MTGKRYKSVGANLECPNGKEYMLVKRDDGFNVCQVCSKYTAKEIVDELNNIAEENEQLKKENYELHKRLGDFEPFEEHIQERTSKTSVNDIIGLIKTDEPTNSVELKKELYK